jgi:GT2 family glycosyltransferase
MTRGSVHAIIVNYRTPDLTVDALTSLLRSSLPDRELHATVIDNGSGDDSLARISALVHDVELIASERNLGFAGGNNLALQRILASVPQGADRHDTFVLLLNSDVALPPDAVGILVAFMETHPDAGIAGPKVVLPDGQLDLACRRGFPTPGRALWKLTNVARLFPTNPRFSGYNLTHLDENETTEVDAVVGAFMLVRLAAIDDAGLLDARFFMYGEDLDWAYRIKQRGWHVWYVPAARVVHLKGATARRQSYRMTVEFYRAMWLFHRKHYARRSPFLLNWLVGLGIVARGLLALAINAVRPADSKRVA